MTITDKKRKARKLAENVLEILNFRIKSMIKDAIFSEKNLLNLKRLKTQPQSQNNLYQKSLNYSFTET